MFSGPLHLSTTNANGPINPLEPSLEVLRPAVAANAYAFVLLARNHPSGRPDPSQADHNTTRVIQTAAAILQIHFVDHLIIGAGHTISNPSWSGARN